MEKNSTEIRAFIAIELPCTVKSFLNRVSSELKRCSADVKWVKPESMHLTLKFLGNTGRDRISLIESALRTACADRMSMNMMVNGVGAFPNLAKPRVIWVGLKDLSGGLISLAAQVEEAAASLGFEREKRSFSPHLTLGRVRSSAGSRDLIEAVRQQMETSGPTFVADRVVLFQSVLKPSGAEYIALSAHQLGQGH
jgi:RNA 2',3'-cyclic 3'-phosphodiesterase